MESKEGFYDGTKLLSMLDLSGQKPEIYMVTTNRSGGKTTYFGRMLVKRFLTAQKKFMLIYRFQHELQDVSGKFFKDIGALFFPGYTMSERNCSKGIYKELYLHNPEADQDDEGALCGYAVTLNAADAIKRMSHLFSDTDSMMMDEFQSETNHYCPEEVRKFISLHTSVARGKGKQARYLPVYMISNPVTLLNPYYTELGISSRLREDTVFLRGNGYVLEQGYIDAARRSQETSGFNRAFSENQYTLYSTQGVYLNDNLSFLEKPEGVGKYLASVRYNRKDYSIKAYSSTGIVYCDNTIDATFPFRISITTDDLRPNYVMLKQNQLFVDSMRWYFERGAFRFRDLSCKECIMSMVSYL